MIEDSLQILDGGRPPLPAGMAVVAMEPCGLDRRHYILFLGDLVVDFCDWR
jgi:hypothetical protein